MPDMTVPAFVTATPLSTVQGSNFSAARSRSPVTPGTVFSTPKNWRMSVSAPTSYKDALIERVTPLDFGRTVADNRADQDEIEELIRLVESTNKSTSPGADPNLTGVWDMIYTTSTSILGTGRPSFLLPSRIVQEINAAELSGRNSETYKFGPIEIENAVEAKLTPVSENKFDVNFVRFIVGGLIKINVENNERFTGWLSVTYLDENLRISRGNKGNVFVLVKK